jgi:HSP20 family protein
MAAGVRPEDLDLSITRDMVIIRGKREETRGVDDSDYFHKELYWGSFSRSIMLPQEVDAENATAIEKFGLLIITLPKLNKDKQTRVKVKSI